MKQHLRLICVCQGIPISNSEPIYENNDKICILTLDGPTIPTSPLTLGKKMVTPLPRESAKFFNMKMRDSLRENGARE